MGLDLTNQYVDETYQKLIQLSGSNQLTDGTGSLVTDLDINASTASLLLGNAEQVSHIDFEVGGDTTIERRLNWNDTDGTLNVGLKGGNVTLQVGQEEVARVVNGTTVALLEAEYRAMKVIGAQGQRLQVDFAIADSDLNSATTLGLVTEDIAKNQEGFITTTGVVRSINTTGDLQGETWNDGDVLYLSATTPGGLTNIKPLTPAHLITIGYVEYAHQNNGKIYVKVDNGYELEELHDVLITSASNGQVIAYDNGIWTNTNVDSGSWDGQYTGSAGIQGRLQIDGSQAGAVQETLEVISSEDTLTAMQLLVTGSGPKIAFQGAHVTNGLTNATLGFQFDATDVNAVKPEIFFDDNGNGSNITSEGDLNISSSTGNINILSPLNAASITGSLQGNADTATSASYALTASYALDSEKLDGKDGATYATTGSNTFTDIQTISNTGGTAQLIFGRVNVVSGGVESSDGFTGSLQGNADTSVSSSYALTASYALNAGAGDSFPYTGSAIITGSLTVIGDTSLQLTDGDNASAATVSKGNSSYLFGINQFPGFTGSILSALGVDEFKITGDTALSIDNKGYAGTNDVSLKASRDVILEADNQVRITSNTTQDYQGVNINAQNFNINLTSTGSGAGSFSLGTPGSGPDSPGLLLSLGTGSYGSNPTVANMLFSGDDAFFSAVGNFYIKNVFNDTGSITVWSENELELRGDTGVSIGGDSFSNPNDPIEIDINGSTFMDSYTSGIMAFQPQITTYTRVTQFQRAFVETPLNINAQGTVEVQTGATLKVINEL